MFEEKNIWKGNPEGITLLYWSLKGITTLLVLMLVFHFFFLKKIGLSLASELSIFGVIFFLYVLYKWLVRKSYSYGISNEHVKFQGGILTNVITNIPYNKITDVAIYQTLFQRILGIYDLAIQTAGSFDAEVIFYGIKKPDLPKNLILERVRKSERK